jgi:hypothetical protein
MKTLKTRIDLIFIVILFAFCLTIILALVHQDAKDRLNSENEFRIEQQKYKENPEN